MIRVTIICFDNALLSSIAALVDAFTIANQLWTASQKNAKPLFSWALASRQGRPIMSSSCVKIGVDGNLPSTSDVIFIPAWHFDSGEKLLSGADEIVKWCGPWIVKQYKRKATVAAGCSGAFILAKTGLLRGKTITTSWWLNDLFTSSFPDTTLEPNKLIVQDERILSAGPVNSHFNLAMTLIEKVAGNQLALLCAKTLLIDINRPTQIAYEILPLQNNHNDEGILLAQVWMQKNIHKSFDMTLAAKAARLSQRTFIRRFKKAVGTTPIAYIQTIRIDLAKRLLESSDLTLESIVERVGYANVSSFRKLFKERTSLSPAEYRLRFNNRGRIQTH